MDRTNPTQPAGMTVHFIESPEAQAELEKRGLTAQDIVTAIDRFQRAEGTVVRTWIGINEHGFFGSTREGWRPDQSDAFAEPIQNIPWVQILELLGRVPAGTTQEFLDTAETQAGGGDHDQVGRRGEAAAMKTIKVSDATHRAIAETAILPLSASGKQQPDGTWLVPIEDDTWEALESQRLPGESDDDTIQRLIRHHREQPLN